MPTNNPRFTIKDYIEIVFHRQQLFVVPFLTVFITAIIGSCLLPKIYRATVSIQVLSNSLTRTFDVSSGLKAQLIVLSERLLSQSYLQGVVIKENITRSKDPAAIQKFVDDLSEHIEIRMVNDSLVNVSYEGRDKKMTLKVASVMAENFIKESFKTWEEEESSAIKFVKNEIKLYQQRVEKAEEAAIIPNPSIKSLRARLLKLEDQLAEYLMDAKEGHPMVIELKDAIEETKQELKKVTQGKEVDEQILDDVRLEREMRVNEALYGQLLNKLEAARISQRLKAEEERTRFRIIDKDRIKVRQIAPNQIKVIFSGFVFGILLGIAIVALAEFIDHSFREGEDIKNYLPVPVAGSIPKIVIEDTEQ